jgi:hypothetical protein
MSCVYSSWWEVGVIVSIAQIRNSAFHASYVSHHQQEHDAIAPSGNQTRNSNTRPAERVPLDRDTAHKTRRNASEQNTERVSSVVSTMANFNPDDLRNQKANRITPTGKQRQGRTAIVMRGMDPLNQLVMNRLIELSGLLGQEKFQNYDLHVLMDQTKFNLTATAGIQKYFRDNNASHLKAPTVFSISEQKIRDEFPAFEKGYMTEPLVDASPGLCCGKPFMWQLLAPAMIVFSHYNQEYDYTWVYEDDVWSVGKPIVDIFHRWDEKLEGVNADLAGFQNLRGKIP